MEKYINQLLGDIEAAILLRWQTCIPHYYEAGMRNPHLTPPKGWKEEKNPPKISGDVRFELSTTEMENWLDGKAELSMFYHFGLNEQQFPTPNRLNDNQLARLVFALHRLWNAFNFTASVPEKAPDSVVYTTLLKRMLEPAMVLNHGHSGIEFCYYDPKDCPFGGYCDCDEIDY